MLEAFFPFQCTTIIDLYILIVHSNIFLVSQDLKSFESIILIAKFTKSVLLLLPVKNEMEFHINIYDNIRGKNACTYEF